MCEQNICISRSVFVLLIHFCGQDYTFKEAKRNALSVIILKGQVDYSEIKKLQVVLTCLLLR